MTDMFTKYDNMYLGDNCECYHHPHFDQHKILASDSTVQFVTDVKGNELGVQVKHNNSFSLYFRLDSLTCGVSIAKLIAESSLSFQIVSVKGETLISKDVQACDVYVPGTSSVKISVTTDESKKLAINSYRMRLTLIWAGGSYELYPEEAGLLIVR